MGILFPLPLTRLSGECRENVNRLKQEHTHAHTRMHTSMHETLDLQWWDRGGGGGIGSQKVYVTQDITDKSLEALFELHAHTQKASGNDMH